MRSLADRYRDLFPALITGVALDPDSGKYHHAWLELLPGVKDGYSVQPGARSGTTSTNYALEENNRQIAPGTVVWLRHRDEDGGVLHFSTVAPASSTSLVITPPAPPGSGSPPGPESRLCLTISDEGGCPDLAGEYLLGWVEALGQWYGSYELPDSGGIEIGLTPDGEGGYTLGLGLSGGSINGGDPFDVPSLPFESSAEVTGYCDGEVTLSLTDGPCDDCDFTIGGEGTLCFGPGLTLNFQNVTPLSVATSVCPVWGEIREGSGITITEITPGLVYEISSTGGGGGPVDWADVENTPTTLAGYGITDGGDVVGPASSTDNAIARFDGTTGKLIQNSLAGISDSGVLFSPSISGDDGTFTNYVAVKGSGVSLNLKITAGTTYPTVDRTLTVTTGDADRTLTISGNTTLGGGNHSGANTGDETAAGLLTKLLTVDGSGSGLDADLLDGMNSGAFAAASHAHAWADVSKTGSSLADLATRSAADLSSGLLALARGGANADLSGTGGAKNYLKQSSSGAAITVGTIPAGDYPDFVAAGGSHAVGGVPDPGATAYTNNPRILGSQAAFVKHSGKIIAVSRVATQQSTTSTTPVDLTTTQHLTFTLDESTDVLIMAGAWVVNNAVAGAAGSIAADVNGSDTTLMTGTCITTSSAHALIGMLPATLSSGSNTIKLQFFTSAGTAFFADRWIMVILRS